MHQLDKISFKFINKRNVSTLSNADTNQPSTNQSQAIITMPSKPINSDFPNFSGGDSAEWFFKVEKVFSFHQT